MLSLRPGKEKLIFGREAPKNWFVFSAKELTSYDFDTAIALFAENTSQKLGIKNSQFFASVFFDANGKFRPLRRATGVSPPAREKLLRKGTLKRVMIKTFNTLRAFWRSKSLLKEVKQCHIP